MIRVCCVCKEKFGEKEPLEDKTETHGFCDPCYAAWKAGWEEKDEHRPNA